jgi:hypothetical protein
MSHQSRAEPALREAGGMPVLLGKQGMLRTRGLPVNPAAAESQNPGRTRLISAKGIARVMAAVFAKERFGQQFDPAGP